jgi:hypothetical protein
MDNDQPADVSTERLGFKNDEIVRVKDCFATCPGTSCLEFFFHVMNIGGGIRHAPGVVVI